MNDNYSAGMYTPVHRGSTIRENWEKEIDPDGELNLEDENGK